MTLKEIKLQAQKLGIPIIEDEGLAYVLNLIQARHVKTILEIGTAIGYSALEMAAFDVSIDTMERDPEMIKLAKHHIEHHEYGHRVHLIEADAKDYKGPLKTYDLIFIDAAKSQYLRFFEKYQTHLSLHGVIVCDNLYFHHLDANVVTNRHTKGLLKRLENFRHYLENHQQFKTTFVSVGDGLSISERVTS